MIFAGRVFRREHLARFRSVPVLRIQSANSISSFLIPSGRSTSALSEWCVNRPEITKTLGDQAGVIEGWDEIDGDASSWHVRFMQIPELSERLVIGRQADFLGYF
jgi:hypothetical protein